MYKMPPPSHSVMCYVSGAISPTKECPDVEKNIEDAWVVGKRLWLKGYTAIIPHLNTKFTMEEAGNYNGLYDSLIAGDCEIIKRCDFIYMMRNFRYSRGALLELAFAIKNNIPAVYEDMEYQGR